MPPSSTDPEPLTPDRPRWELEQIAVALRGLQFGEVTVIVQDGVVIQVDRLERRRLRRLRRRENGGSNEPSTETRETSD